MISPPKKISSLSACSWPLKCIIRCEKHKNLGVETSEAMIPLEACVMGLQT